MEASVAGGTKRKALSNASTKASTSIKNNDKPASSDIDRSVYEIKDLHERLEMFQYHLSVHTRMPIKLSEVSQHVIHQKDARTDRTDSIRP